MSSHPYLTRARRHRVTVGAIAAAACALALGGCSTGSGVAADAPSPTPTAQGKITLSIATFNDFGYTQKLLDEYTTLHPNITIKQKIAKTSNDAKANFVSKLKKGGAGLADVQAVDVDWMPIVLANEPKFIDLTDPATVGRWLAWKTAEATAPDGKLLGYGTDIGPEAICYRQDLFAKYGLPSSPSGVADLLGGNNATWKTYFSVGENFVSKTDGKVAWYDSPDGTYQAMVGQLANPYENTDGTPKDLATNTAVKNLFKTVATESKDKGLSAHHNEWTAGWTQSFKDSSFATMVCPPWMTASIQSNAPDVTGWNIANVMPGGAGNWGGSFLVVPSAGKNAAAAKEFASWLTSPAQQQEAYGNANDYPSQLVAETSDPVEKSVDKYMNDAPVGTIFRSRALAVGVTPYKGPNYFSINDGVINALVNYDVTGKGTVSSNWNDAVKAYQALKLG